MWLAERIGGCVREGSLVVASDLRAASPEGVVGVGVVAGGRGGSSSRRAGRRSASAEGWQQQQQSQQHARKHRRGHHQRQGTTTQQQQQQQHRQDPLGLLEVADELRRKGLVALEVLGSLGVLGGLALWVTRHYLHLQQPLQPYGWVVGEWERFWYGLR